MCCNRSLNNSTNWLDKWYLRIKKNKISKKFSKEMVLSLYIIKTSNVKIFKLISPQIVKEIFSFRDALSYPSRKQTDFQISSVHSVFSVTECMKFLGPKILRHKLKQLEKFKEFRKAIKQWKAAICPFRLCKTYIHRLGFIWWSVCHICFPFLHYLLV